jgi:putative spermidine/putrescine transport system permease protein
VAIAYLLVHGPTLAVALASLSSEGRYVALTVLPKSLTLSRYWAISSAQYQSILLSLELAAVAAIGALLIGVPAALGLVRGRRRPWAAMILRAPLQIPAVVIGVTFLQTSYAVSDALDIDLAGSFASLAAAHIFIAVPYVVSAVGAIAQLEEAASSLGATRWRGFRRVTLPLLMPGIFAGGLYAFMVSFGDVSVSLFLAGSGRTTYPVEVFSGIEQDFDPSILASATLVILFSFAAMLLVQRLVGLDTLLRTGTTPAR